MQDFAFKTDTVTKLCSITLLRWEKVDSIPLYLVSLIPLFATVADHQGNKRHQYQVLGLISTTIINESMSVTGLDYRSTPLHKCPIASAQYVAHIRASTPPLTYRFLRAYVRVSLRLRMNARNEHISPQGGYNYIN